MSVNVVLNVRLCLSHANRDVGQITHDTPPPPPIRDCFFWPFSGRECFPRAFRFAFLATSTPRDTAVARLEPIVNREHTVHMFKFCFYQVLVSETITNRKLAFSSLHASLAIRDLRHPYSRLFGSSIQ